MGVILPLVNKKNDISKNEAFEINKELGGDVYKIEVELKRCLKLKKTLRLKKFKVKTAEIGQIFLLGCISIKWRLEINKF